MKHRRGTSAKEAKQVLRLLVLSDSHGDAGSVYRAVAAQPEAAAVLYLGDGAADLAAAAAAFPRLAFYPVRGNGDFAPDAAGLPYAREECFGGKRFFLTHGHLYGVKTDPLRVVYAARERGADILLYGHTHPPYQCMRLAGESACTIPFDCMPDGLKNRPECGMMRLGLPEPGGRQAAGRTGARLNLCIGEDMDVDWL